MSDLFLDALQARLPLLRATTSDTVNLSDVVSHMVPSLKVGAYSGPKFLLEDVFLATEAVELTETMYSALVDRGKTLILINQEDESGLSINVGEVPVPVDLICDLVQEITDHKADTVKLMPAFRGLTLKSASEIIRLVLTQDKCLTPSAVLRVRTNLAGKLKGLSLVDTTAACYLPNPDLEVWVGEQHPYFERATDPRLIPRGLLFYGVPGTGKSQGAKYIARQWGIPLYRLDLSSSMAKWVGESEANFGRVLSTLDQEEPCVFLIDEVEKLFESGEDAGTTSRILSQLLWWLQEHTSRILTVMTTNGIGKLPAELYRSGRIDFTLELGALKKPDCYKLILELLTSFNVKNTPSKGKWLLNKVITGNLPKDLTPAVVTQAVFDYVKDHYLCLS